MSAILLAGCSAGPAAEHPVSLAATPTHTPSATPPVVPDIPIQGTGITAVTVASPPVRVRVPDAGIDVTVEPVGVLADGDMELPADTHVAGWYEYGPVPSSATGATILAAHVDSLRYGLGPFSRLKEIAVGAAVTVTTADGVEHAYVMAATAKISKAEIPLGEVFDRDGAPRLVMITCGGQFNRDTGHYLDNILATATPVAP